MTILNSKAVATALTRPEDWDAEDRTEIRCFLDDESIRRVLFIAREITNEVGGKPTPALAIRYLLAEAGWLASGMSW